MKCEFAKKGGLERFIYRGHGYMFVEPCMIACQRRRWEAWEACGVRCLLLLLCNVVDSGGTSCRGGKIYVHGRGSAISPKAALGGVGRLWCCMPAAIGKLKAINQMLSTQCFVSRLSRPSPRDYTVDSRPYLVV